MARRQLPEPEHCDLCSVSASASTGILLEMSRSPARLRLRSMRLAFRERDRWKIQADPRATPALCPMFRMSDLGVGGMSLPD